MVYLLKSKRFMLIRILALIALLVGLILSMYTTGIGMATITSDALTYISGWEPSKAVDNDTDTVYSSVLHQYNENATEWLRINLGSKVYSIEDVRLTPRTGGAGFPVDFKIEYSDDGSNFTTALGAEFKNFSNPGQHEVVIPFKSPVNAQYIRIYATKLSTEGTANNYRLQIAEVNIDQRYEVTSNTQPENAVYAIDGDISTYYSSSTHDSANNEEWLQVDLGTAQNDGVKLARITPRDSGYGFPVNFKIQYTDNPTSGWTDVPGATFTNVNALDGKQKVISFYYPIKARYFRLDATTLGADDNGSYSLQVPAISFETVTDEDKTLNPVSIVASSGGETVGLLADGNWQTYWGSFGHVSPSYTESFTLTYDMKYPIHKLVLTPRENGTGYPVDFKLSYSQNGMTFTDIPGQSYTNVANPGSTDQEFEFDPVYAKAIKVEASILSQDNGSYCFEMADAKAYKWDTNSDTWAATDNLGRTLPAYSKYTPKRENKFVGIFYTLWLNQQQPSGENNGPFDLNQIFSGLTNAQQYEDAMNDYTNGGGLFGGKFGEMFWYNEPLLGYYTSLDRYVFRKHAQMLADSGVDCVIFDNTNDETFQACYMTLCQEWENIRNHGGKTPQIVFWAPFTDVTYEDERGFVSMYDREYAVISSLYDNLYGPGLYSDLWYKLDGKPLIISDPRGAKDNGTLKNFFTYRQAQWYIKDMPVVNPNPYAVQWFMSESYPQRPSWGAGGDNEQISVSVCQGNDGIDAPISALSDQYQPLTQYNNAKGRGRSFKNGVQPSINKSEMGYNFAEQWSRVFEVDPKFVFVYAWNEWQAARFHRDWGTLHVWPETGYYNMFVDQASTEYSKDVEPMDGSCEDNYYYQLANYVRMYKGLTSPAYADSPKTISVDGNFDDWKDIKQEFRDDLGDKASRDDDGYGTLGNYVNTTGRNDFKICKVARDANNIYFYVKTVDNITSYSDTNWMRLFIKTSDTGPNWNDYNFVINRTGITGTTTTLEQVASGGGWNWNIISNNIQYKITGREMELAIPRSYLGLADLTKQIQFEFKWHDNMQAQGDVNEFTTNGDAAPNGRFNYRYVADSFGNVGSSNLQLALPKPTPVPTPTPMPTPTPTPTPVPVSNVALYKSVTACSSNSEAELACNAVNGRIDGHWCSTDAAPHWLTVDLGQAYSINRWVVKHAHLGGDLAEYNTKDFKLQVSNDNINFTDVDSVTNNTADITDRNVNTSGRYVRLYITAGAQDGQPNYARICEFEIYGTPVNIALNKSTTACSSNSDDELPGNAVDGNVNNHWCSTDAGPHWLTVDLGQVNYINRWVVKHAHLGGDLAEYNTKDFKLQVSNDNINFTDVDPVTNNTADITDRNVNTSGRYVRLYITAGAQDGQPNYARIREFEIYGDTVPMPTPTLTPTPMPTPTPTPAVNWALNKNVTACSSTSETELASNAVDGNNGNHWCSNDAGPHWLTVDLGQVYNIARVVVKHAHSGGDLAEYNTKDFKVDVSNDDIDFTNAFSVTNNTADITDRYVNTSGRYVRLYITKGAQDGQLNYARIHEFEIYGEIAPTPTPSAVSNIIIDDSDGAFTVSNPAPWSYSGEIDPVKYGGTEHGADSGGNGSVWGKWTPTIVTPGNYKVYVWYASDANRATNAPFTVYYSGGKCQTVTINQQIKGGMWVPLGTWNFDAGTSGYVLASDKANGYVMMDAVAFVYKDAETIETPVSLFTCSGDSTAVSVYTGNTAAEKFTATCSFNSIDVECPNWAAQFGKIMTLKLYEWNTDYSTTISGTPITSMDYIDYCDNGWLKLNFTAQCGGKDYLWVLSSDMTSGSQVGVWKYSDSTDPSIAYFNGNTTTGDYLSRVYYIP